MSQIIAYVLFVIGITLSASYPILFAIIILAKVLELLYKVFDKIAKFLSDKLLDTDFLFYLLPFIGLVILGMSALLI